MSPKQGWVPGADEVRVAVVRDPLTLGVKIYICQHLPDKTRVFGADMQSYVDYDREEVCDVGPTIRLPIGVLEKVVEAAAEQGIEPPPASYVAGKLEATERHLEDMRVIVMKKMGVPRCT